MSPSALPEERQRLGEAEELDARARAGGIRAVDDRRSGGRQGLRQLANPANLHTNGLAAKQEQSSHRKNPDFRPGSARGIRSHGCGECPAV